jgi:hypothetical protein
LRYVASIEMVVLSGACSASPIKIWANMPISLQRFHLLYSVFGGPYSTGASHQRHPLRLMKIMPLSTRRSSTRARPRLFGKYGRSRCICASVSQYKLLIISPNNWGF